MANWISRGVLTCVVITPNVEFDAVVSTWFGFPNCTLLNKLKNSVRNSSPTRSVIRVFLNSAKS